MSSPDRSSTQVDVEVSPAVLDAHEAVLLHLRVHHVVDGVGRFDLQLLQVPRPDFVDPINLPDDPRRHNLFKKTSAPVSRLRRQFQSNFNQTNRIYPYASCYAT